MIFVFEKFFFIQFWSSKNFSQLIFEKKLFINSIFASLKIFSPFNFRPQKIFFTQFRRKNFLRSIFVSNFFLWKIFYLIFERKISDHLIFFFTIVFPPSKFFWPQWILSFVFLNDFLVFLRGDSVRKETDLKTEL